MTRTLVLEIGFPGFYIDESDTSEDVEIGMQLANESVVVVFAGHEGDEPGAVLRHLEGRIRRYRVVPEGTATA